MTPTNSFKKGKETKGLFERFFLFASTSEESCSLIYSVASILYTLIGIMGAFYFKFLIDDILPYSLEKTLHVLSIGAIILIVCWNVILSCHLGVIC
jgi:ATP-binding cassette, subfamily C, bacteriocin exporter